MDVSKLRYHGLWAYTGLVALSTQVVSHTVETFGAALVPIVTVITLDLYKHRASK